MSKDSELVETPDSALMVSEFEEDVGKGNEEVDASSISMPFLAILQDNSPQCKKREDSYIEGADAGMFLDTISNSVYDGEQGIEVVNVYFQNRYVEWVPRDEGGGFITTHPPDQIPPFKRDERGRDMLENGHQIVRTHYHYVLILNREEQDFRQAVIGMSSTQIKTSAKWNTQIRDLRMDGSKGKFNPPRYASTWKLTTKLQSNPKGSWYGWMIERLNYLNLQDPYDHKIYHLTKETIEMISAGRVEVKPDQSTEEAAPAPNSAGVDPKSGEGIPF